ncbi:GerAB/ArcD/ProY family transporter [Cytobacillus suaedae]|nr:GerAB/ArcD/ProY family transporter [Cytobacillus suaedae]
MSAPVKETLSSFHIVLLTYQIQSGVVLFSLPGLLAEHFGTNGWIVIFFLSGTVMANIFVISLAYKFGNGTSIFEVLENSFSKIFLYPFYFGLALVWSLLGCMVGKKYILLFQMLSFPNTNPMLFKVAFNILAFLLLIKGLYNISKAATIIFLLTVWIVFLEVFHIPEIELSRYTTFFLQGGNDWVKGILDAYSAFLGYELAILFFPYVTKKSKLIRSVYIGNLVTTSVYLSVMVVCFGFYSYQQLSHMLFPVLDLLAFIQLPFMARIENILFTAFFLKTLLTTVLYYWATLQVLKRIFKKTHDQLISICFIIFTFVLSFFPSIMSEVNLWLTNLAYVQIVIAFGLPLIVLMAIFIKRVKRRGKNVDV